MKKFSKLQIIVCDKCRRKQTIGSMSRRRKLPDGRVQHYLRCRKCKHETHAYYMTVELERMQDELAALRADPSRSAEFQAKLREYQSKFQALNVGAKK